MEKIDIWIIVLFILVIASIGLSLYEINKFMPILKTCDDDFTMINKCHCVPCSWKDSDKINGRKCFDMRNLTNGS